ncbi:MAG: hypothetical protein ACTSPL_06660, partial [Candidatus Odinarchaeia archaeon]
MRYGLAKIHWCQNKLGMEANATFISTPDETVTKNISRWHNGVGYGGKISWGEGREKLIFLDVKPNACGMLVGGLDELPSPHKLIEAIKELNSQEEYIDNIKIHWDFNKGNHFIDVFAVFQSVSINLPPYVFIIHSSAPELKGENPAGLGLYYDKSQRLKEMMKVIDTPFGQCRILLDNDAKEYLEFCKYSEEFSKQRRRIAAEKIFGDYIEIANRTHQGLINYNEIILGAHYIENSSSSNLYPIALRADLPAYLVEGVPNLSDEIIDSLGFGKRAETLGVYHRLKNANLLPHGGGYTFPD